MLVYELSRGWLPTMTLPLQTPNPGPSGETEGTIIDPSRPVKVHTCNLVLRCNCTAFSTKQRLAQTLGKQPFRTR